MSYETMRNSGIGVTAAALGMDGMKMCGGCNDAFVLHGYCTECLRISDVCEAKRLEEKRFMEAYERRHVGLVPYQSREPYAASEAFTELPGKIQAVLLAGAGASVSLALVAGWYLAKAMILFALEVSR